MTFEAKLGDLNWRIEMLQVNITGITSQSSFSGLAGRPRRIDPPSSTNDAGPFGVTRWMRDARSSAMPVKQRLEARLSAPSHECEQWMATSFYSPRSGDRSLA